MTSPIIVTKIGGSLFDLPDLPDRLQAKLTASPKAHHVLVTGGGALVEQIRSWHERWPLDEELAHWISVDLMDVTARLLHARMLKLQVPEFQAPALILSSAFQNLKQRSQSPGITFFCTAQWLRQVEPNQPGKQLPASWEVTSDAIAGRLAIVLEASKLILLKSTTPRESVSGKETSGMSESNQAASLETLTKAGLIDPYLPRLASELPPLQLVNLRPEQQSAADRGGSTSGKGQ
jgi:aspartokinase-like uncharacterized kinase